MRPRLIAACLALVLLGATPVVGRGAPAGFRVGVATVDVTPPAFSTGDPAFALCPPGLDGPRAFGLSEPYVDVDGSGEFERPEPFCDANLNGHYDGMYLASGLGNLARRMHDPVDARALALSDGVHTVVVESVESVGLFQNFIDPMRARAKALRPGITDVVVSANHNESTPDSLGIFGPDTPAGNSIPAASGTDDYYMAFLIERAAQAAAKAYDDLRPATLWARQFRLPANLTVHLSHNFPTTDDQRRPAAIDPKVGVLQARDAAGKPIVTVMSLAAHNQQIGHASASAHDVSADWPGYFHHAVERQLGGTAMFLVGDNGSIEDPETVPPVCKDACYGQAQATGEALAASVVAETPAAVGLADGVVRSRRDVFFVPLENNLLRAAAVAGIIERPTYAGGVDVGRVGTDARTSVAVVDVGPDLQLLANPGESFPALAVGSHWGVSDAGCPERTNPPVWTWFARAKFRFQVGLADDMLGYLLPPWANSSAPGVFATTCFDDADTDKDPKGHQHKLETEGIGPTGSGLVADHLTALLAQDPDANARVATGRYVTADGSLSRRPEGAVGIVLLDGTVVALPNVQSFGDTPLERHGVFVDYDGDTQAAPDLITSGMRVTDGRRLYVEVYPDVDIKALGPAVLATTSAAPPGPAAAEAAGRRGLPPTGGGGPLAPVWIATLLSAAMLVRRGVRRAR